MTQEQRRIAHVALMVRDYDEAIAWFTGVLGFTLVEDAPREPGKRWVLVAPPGKGGTSLLLARAATGDQRRTIGQQTGGRVFLFMHTDDFARDFAQFKERGVRFTESPRVEPYGTVAVFEDLHGNRWDLIQPKEQLAPRTSGPHARPARIANRSMPSSAVLPEVPYPDVRAAVTWLCATLGFVERLRIAEHRAQLVFGDGAIVVTALRDAPFAPRSTMIRVADVDAHHRHVARSGARVLSAPTDYPYGERQYTVEDLAGHRWIVSESVSDADPATWGGTLLLE